MSQATRNHNKQPEKGEAAVQSGLRLPFRERQPQVPSLPPARPAQQPLQKTHALRWKLAPHAALQGGFPAPAAPGPRPHEAVPRGPLEAHLHFLPPPLLPTPWVLSAPKKQSPGTSAKCNFLGLQGPSGNNPLRGWGGWGGVCNQQLGWASGCTPQSPSSGSP